MVQINVAVKSVVTETPDAYSLVLEKHPALKSYEAGQFVNVYCTVEGEFVQRSYSFSSSPSVDADPVLTIKKVPRGKASNYLHETIRPGNILTISAPLGRFTLDNSTHQGHLLLIAGGSGITPIFGLLKARLKRLPSVHFTLVYANRNQHIIFRNFLDELAKRHRDRFNLHYFIEEGQLADTLGSVYPGQVSGEFLSNCLNRPDIPVSNTSVYVCGPEGMMQKVLNWLQDIGIHTDQIRTEYFIGTKPQAPESSPVDDDAYEVRLLNLKGNQAVLEVSGTKDILSEFLDEGYDLPHSCREAMCGSCAARLVKGEVDMKENYALTDAKLKEGYVLLCQSIPLSKKVVLKYDL